MKDAAVSDVGATMTKAAVRCGGFEIAARLPVMPIADGPVMPTFPLHQLCFAIHSTVS